MPDMRTYRDRRPIAVPELLTDLAGPSRGLVELPSGLAWTGRRSYDLGNQADTRILYERVIVEASGTDDLSGILDAGLLRATWPHLFLPQRVRQLWEARFPELASAA